MPLHFVEDAGVTYRKLSNSRLALVILCGALVFAFFAYRDQSGRGMVAALSLCSLLSPVTILGEIARGVRFWCTVAIISFLHVLLVFLPQWSDLHFPEIILTPLVILDMYVCARILIVAAATHPT